MNSQGLSTVSNGNDNDNTENTKSVDERVTVAVTAPKQANEGNYKDAMAIDDIKADRIKTSSPPMPALASKQMLSPTDATEHEIIHQSIKENSFVDHLKFIVELKSDLVFSTWYDEKGKAVNNYTFQQIWDESGHCAYLLRNKWGVNKGDRVVLCYDFGLHFFAIFLGCLRAGVTAVLVYPPGPPLVKSLAKMNKVVEDCSPALILTQTSINVLRAADRANPVSKSRAMWPSGVKFQVTDRTIRHDALAGHKNSAKRASRSLLSRAISGRSPASTSTMAMKSFDEPTIEGSDIAFLQYTSGSTGNPKGVMVTHDALRANVELLHSGWLECLERDLGDMSKLPERITTFSWLPQYHDLGLIQLTIVPLAGAFRTHMMSPVSFIRNPLLWMDLISKHKCHFTVAPDFGYRLVTRKFNEIKARGGDRSDPIPNLDLSSMFRFQNAAEPIRLDTTELFSAVFSPHGLRKEWFMAGYGLAEHVVGVSYQQGFQVSSIREDEDLHPFVAIAHRDTLHHSVDIVIVDPNSRKEVHDNTTGEIWIAGPCVAAGYYGQPDLTAETFHAALQGVSCDANTNANTNADDKVYLRTGDYGFYQDDYLYICGRKKDIIIVNGVNYYPQDIEHTVQDASSAVRPGCVAAFSSNETDGDGRLQIVFEIRSSHISEVESVCRNIQQAVLEHIGLAPATITAIEERTISKTTSGKIQRRRNRRRLHDEVHKVVLHIVAKDGIAEQSKSCSSGNGAARGTALEDKDFDAIVMDTIGVQIKAGDTWKEIGLSSMAELELRQALSKRYSTTIPPDSFDLFPSVIDLRTSLEASAGRPLPTNLPSLKKITTVPNEKPLSQATATAIQFVGGLAILFLFALPIIPAYEFGKMLANGSNTQAEFTIGTSSDEYEYKWAYYPFVVPVWLTALSVEVILMKWIVVGRYREGYASYTSIYFLRWWFVDRLIHVWETFVGRFIVNTPLMTLYCYLMGANVHRSSNICVSIREFDLVKIGAHATVGEPIRCRMFGPWRDEEGGPTLRFRKVEVGSGTKIKGVLCPGVKVGSNCQVQRLCVMPEGAQAPSNTAIKGNPAFVASSSDSKSTCATTDKHNDSSESIAANNTEAMQATASAATTAAGSSNNHRWIIIGAMKLLWLVVELYIAFSCMLVGNIMVNGQLRDWRYSRLQYWVVSIGIASLLLLLFSIILKWVLIGKKKPGKARATIMSDLADWACDYHFNRSCMLLYILTSNSMLWNLVMMAHGMDVDLRSKIFAVQFPPSKADLIRVRRSFISMFSFDIKHGDQYKMVTIEDSSIGIMVSCKAGVTVRKALVSPRTTVAENLIRPQQHPQNQPFSGWELLQIVVKSTVLYATLIMVVAGSFIPAYEFWMSMAKPQTSAGAVPVLAAAVVIQTIVWIILQRIVEFIVFAGKNTRTKPWSLSLYTVYLSFCHWVMSWSFTTVLWGTSMMNAVLRFQGVKVEGRLLYFGCRMYEPTHVTVADGCVIDDARVHGHYGVFSTVTIKKCHLSGVLHPQCSVVGAMEAFATKEDARLMEHGPQHVIMDVGDDSTNVEALQLDDCSPAEHAV